MGGQEPGEWGGEVGNQRLPRTYFRRTGGSGCGAWWEGKRSERGRESSMCMCTQVLSTAYVCGDQKPTWVCPLVFLLIF